MAVKPTPAIDRILRRTSKPDGEFGCWHCTLGMLPNGYSTVAVWDPEAKRAWPRRSHRVAYEHYRGPIPDGLVIDHLCSVRNCINPAHLEAVTIGENTRRGESPAAVTARNGYCQRGHEMTLDNVHVHHSCRECERQGRRRRRSATVSSAPVGVAVGRRA